MRDLLSANQTRHNQELLDTTIDTILAIRHGDNVNRTDFIEFAEGISPRYLKLLGLDPDDIEPSLSQILGVDTHSVKIYKDANRELGASLAITASNWRLDPQYSHYRDDSDVPEPFQGTTLRVLDIDIPYGVGKDSGICISNEDKVNQSQNGDTLQDKTLLSVTQEDHTILHRYLYISLGSRAVLQVINLPINPNTNQRMYKQQVNNSRSEKQNLYIHNLDLTADRALLLSKIALKYAPTN